MGQLWDMTTLILGQILGHTSLKFTLSLISGNCVYLLLASGDDSATSTERRRERQTIRQAASLSYSSIVCGFSLNRVFSDGGSTF